MMRKNMNRLLSIGLCFVLLFSLCACSGEGEWVFLLNGERVFKKDVAAFAYIYTTEYNIKSTDQLEEIYEDATTYGEFYKQELENDIVSTVLLHKEAKKNRVKLSDEMKEQITLATADVIERFGEKNLEEAGVLESDIEKVYEMKMLAEAYLDSLSVDEEGSKSDEGEGKEFDKLERYVKVYQVTFPTVVLDEEGMVMSDEEGNLKKVSPAEASEMERQANEFAELATQGEDMKELLGDYGSNVTGIEKYMKYSDLDEGYKDAIDDMGIGSVSNVIESNYGFYVVRLLERDDVEYAEEVELREQETQQVSVKKEEIERLYSEYAQPNREYKSVDIWETIEIDDYIH